MGDARVYPASDLWLWDGFAETCMTDVCKRRRVIPSDYQVSIR